MRRLTDCPHCGSTQSCRVIAANYDPYSERRIRRKRCESCNQTHFTAQSSEVVIDRYWIANDLDHVGNGKARGMRLRVNAQSKLLSMAS